MKIIVDQEICIGCGACAAICPEGFKMGPSGKSEYIEGAGEECYQKGAQSCPVQAISVQ
jgi:ferredoxin